ncbi:glycoside hydrolase family 16 protein [Kineosporiaceae bacterium B12]|nr:glycoside hydrolase family 16 protein [Kineococcus rubinsiae]
MPKGDLPGWRQVFTEDFTTPAPLGSFPGRSYSASWTGYDGFLDTAKRGTYAPGKVLSVHDGALDMFLHSENGRPQVAAPVPLVDGQWNGQTYGRYSVRFRSDPVAGYKTAWLLWPTDDDWNKGEIDFPEGSLAGTIDLFNHCPGDPSRNCFAAGTGTSYADWHVATVEWTPAGVSYSLDGRAVGFSDVSPSTAMRWTLQTETDGRTTSAKASGHLLVDWAVMYARAA